MTDVEGARCFLAHIIYLCLWGQEASWEMNEAGANIKIMMLFCLPRPGAPPPMKEEAGGAGARL